jgi:Xaa-Pro aminopeptidase
MNYLFRQKEFTRTLNQNRLDGFVVTHSPNLRYLCGYTGSNGLLLFLGGRPVFFTDGRYTQQAREEVHGARIVIAKGALLEAAGKLTGAVKSAIIGFEADLTTVVAANQLRRLPHKNLTWKPTSGLIMQQRLVKDAGEQEIILDAVGLGAAAYENAIHAIKPGVSEAEIAGRLEFSARQAGADGMSFETIVASGKRSALPHGRATGQPLPRRGFVVVDSGVVVEGYCSDMTRTIHLGRANREERGWYQAVLEAQLEAINTVKAGVTAGEVDEAARRILRRARLDRYFTHSTGHGVGLEIHEPPRIGKGQQERLQAGMVVTIEPGIYIPDKGGIRIEDMVLVTNDGCRVLTPIEKQLIEI